MKIKELEERTGLKRSTIRLYEQYGLIAPHTEEQNGRTLRIYSEEDAEQLRTVATLRKALFSMDEIKRMTEDPDLIGPILEDHRSKVDQMAEELAALQTALAGIQSAPSSARALSRELEQTPIQKLPVPPADVHPRYRELDELYPPTEPEDNWPKPEYFTRPYFVWLGVSIFLAILLGVFTARAQTNNKMVNIPFQDVGTRIQTFRYQVRDHIETVGGWDIWTFEDISTEISFKELDAGAKLTRKPEDGKAVWTLERNVVWREDGVNYKKTEEGQLIISSDGERTYTMNGAEAAEEDRKVLDSFVKVAEKYQAPIGFRDVLSGVLFGLGVLLVFHAVYGAVQVRVGWIYHVTPLRPLYRRIPVIVYAINMERLSKVQRDFISLYGRGTWLDKDLPPK